MRPTAPALQAFHSEEANSEELLSPMRRVLAVAGLLALAVGFLACTPPTPAQKASEAARNLNLDARWGKMEEAASRSSPDERKEFLKRRAEWSDGIRVVDTELAGMDMIDATHAVVQVDVSWNFTDDPTSLRTTRLSQDWSDAKGKWVLMSEERIGGDLGLFGEDVKRVDESRDKHFPSRTIH